MPDGRRLRGLRGEDIIRALSRAGWYESSQSGSHVQLRNSQTPGLKVTVSIHKGRELDVKTVRSILRQARIAPEDFEALL